MPENKEHWKDEAVKIGGQYLVDFLVDMSDKQDKIFVTLKEFAERHTISEEQIKDLNSAFPAGDKEGHKRYHELLIRKNEEIRRLRIAIQEKTISGLIWAFILFTALAFWEYIKNHIKG